MRKFRADRRAKIDFNRPLEPMNAKTLLPPLLALVIGGGMIGTQQAAIRNLEERTVLLRQRIELAGVVPEAGGGESLATRLKDGGESEERRIDWGDLGEKVARGQSGPMPDIRAMMELQSSLIGLSGDELLAELDRLAAADLGKEARQSLEAMVIGVLADKDPKALLTRFSDRANDDTGMVSWQMANAFGKWRGEDPAAALAWLDAEIAKGTFESRSLDGKSDSRMRFESMAVLGLLSSDPEAARRRVEALPEDQRKDLFRHHGMYGEVAEDAQPALADLVRETLPEGEWADAYGPSITMMVGDGGFGKVDGFIENIGATGEERSGIVRKAAVDRMQMLARDGEINRASVDEMREWASEQTPGEVDSVTGEALRNVWGESDFEGRAGLVAELHDEGAGDELIVSFLDGNMQVNGFGETARSLAGRIADEEKRREALERIGLSDGGTAIEAEEIIIGN